MFKFPAHFSPLNILTYFLRPFSERYLISRGYGHPQDKDSGGSDDDMSDEGPDDMLPSTSRDRLDGSGHRLEFMIGDNVLPYDMTVYQAVQQFGSTPMFDMTSGTGNDSGADPENRNSPGSVLMYGSPGIWARIHTIYYRPIPASGAAGMSSDTLNANMSGKLVLLFFFKIYYLFSYMNIYMGFIFHFS